MTFTEISKLHEMGFSNEQIISLSGTMAKEPEKEPEAEKEPEKEPEQEPEQEQAKENPEIKSLKDQVTAQQKQIADLIKQMQSNNLKNASVNILPEDDIQKKCDEAMAELIRPKIKEVK